MHLLMCAPMLLVVAGYLWAGRASLAAGGVPGVASVIFWGLHVPVQVSYFVINAVLLLFALKILGFKFCIKTIYAVFLLTTLTAAFQKYGGGAAHKTPPR